MTAILAAKPGRQQLTVHIPHFAVATALVGCVASWLLYGVALLWFVRSLIGSVEGPVRVHHGERGVLPGRGTL